MSSESFSVCNSSLSVDAIYERIWALSPHVKDQDCYLELQDKTARLIALYKSEGRLSEDPFLSSGLRTLSFPVSKLNDLLKDSTCLITGGLGVVGGSLVNTLLGLQIKNIVIVDKQSRESGVAADERISFIQANICNQDELGAIFDLHNPDFVFHTAAQRDPGYAESHIYETVMDNISGTINVVNACEKNAAVKQCVFSSTGKASRYFTNEVYAATKKICEFILDCYAGKSNKLYSFVRFTHILENSLMNAELSDVITSDHLAIHSPGKYVTAQNVTEASLLMLNSLLYARKGLCQFSIVRNLEWPIESLEVALYHIDRANSAIPVIFKGNPPGYSEKFFRGQLDWTRPHELNLLINAYENKNSYLNDDGDIIISNICATEYQILMKYIFRLKYMRGEDETKKWLLDALKEMVEVSLKEVDDRDTLSILKWGLEPQFMIAEQVTPADFRNILDLLTNSLEDSLQLENRKFDNGMQQR